MPHAAPGPPGSAPLLRGCHAPRRSCALRPLSRPRAGRPTASRRPPHASPRSHDSLMSPVAHLTSRVAVPTACLSPSCRAAVSTPVSRLVPRPSPVRRWVPPCSTTAVQCRRCALHRPRPSRAVPAWPWAAHAGRASTVSPGCARVAMGRAPAWPLAAPALCDWAERGFGPVALELAFIFF
jgi:hypothetical protein